MDRCNQKLKARSKLLIVYSLNKLELYSRISALGPVGHCTVAISRERCVFHVDRVHVWTSTGGSGPCGRMWTEGRGFKNVIFCGRHKWMAPMWARTISSADQKWPAA